MYMTMLDYEELKREAEEEKKKEEELYKDLRAHLKKCVD